MLFLLFLFTGYYNTVIFIYIVFMALILDAIGLKKLMFLCSVDYYKDLACCGYKRECQDFQKILQLLNSSVSIALIPPLQYARAKLWVMHAIFGEPPARVPRSSWRGIRCLRMSSRFLVAVSTCSFEG